MNRCFFISILCTSISCGQYPEHAADLLNRAYSGERNPDGQFIAELKAEDFDEPSTGKFALIQAYSATEQPDLVRESVRMARDLVDAEPDGCRRDMAMIILSPLLALNGEPRAGAELAEQSLATMDFKRFTHSDDPFIRFLGNRFGVGSFGWERFLKDNLRLQLGGYYLNRDRDDGGPDLEKAHGYFSKVTASDNRERALADARFKNLQNRLPEQGDARPYGETKREGRSPGQKETTQSSRKDGVSDRHPLPSTPDGAIARSSDAGTVSRIDLLSLAIGLGAGFAAAAAIGVWKRKKPSGRG